MTQDPAPRTDDVDDSAAADPTTDPAATDPAATEPAGTPDPALAGAGLSATGKTADQFSPGDGAPGTTYGSPTGAGGEELETVAVEPAGDDPGSSATEPASH